MSTMSATEQKSRRLVLTGLIGFFAVFMVVDAVMVTVAISTQTGVVTEQAYEKGLAYNQTIQAAELQAQQGWHHQITLNHNQMAFSWQTRDGQPIQGGQVRARLIRPVQDGLDQDLILSETAPGIYTVPITIPLPGQWVVEVMGMYHDHPLAYRQTVMVQ